MYFDGVLSAPEYRQLEEDLKRVKYLPLDIEYESDEFDFKQDVCVEHVKWFRSKYKVPENVDDWDDADHDFFVDFMQMNGADYRVFVSIFCDLEKVVTAFRMVAPDSLLELSKFAGCYFDESDYE